MSNITELAFAYGKERAGREEAEKDLRELKLAYARALIYKDKAWSALIKIDKLDPNGPIGQVARDALGRRTLMKDQREDKL